MINFTVTPRGLEDQLLVVVCGLERADLEQKNDRLIVQISDDKNELAEIESKILELLSASSGNILDDETLINTLAASKITSVNVTERMVDAEQVVQTITTVREEYRVVAQRASILFFTIADMSRVDTMYSYSLMYFVSLYRQRIQETDRCEGQELRARLDVLLSDLNASVYTNMCRGLFEKDKLLFSFLMAVNTLRGAGKISDAEWSYFVRSADAATLKLTPANPAASWLSLESWQQIYNIGSVPRLASVASELRDESKALVWSQWSQSFSGETPAGGILPEPYHSQCTPFQRLLLVKLFRRDKVIAGIKDFVTTELGPRFVKPPPFDLKAAYLASNPRTPLIFVLSPGANPMTYIQKLAREKGMEESRFKSLSLGQGQGPIAEEMMANGRRDGDWVCLFNCHLSASFLPTLDRILEQSSSTEIHEDYRLILTSMPTEVFPVPILQNSIKITNEPPKGLAANVMRTFLDISEEEYESCRKPAAYKKLLFGLAFFHAVMQERRRFGAIGFNIPYEFMTSDLEISKKQLLLYLNESASGEVPWTTLTEIVGDVNYAGRVTDDKDQRCVRSLLSKYFSPHILNDDYNFSESGIYYAPKVGSLQSVRDYVAGLPDDTPEAFGMHANADITFQLQETTLMLETLVAIQPRASGGAATAPGAAQIKEKTPDEIVQDVALSIESRLPGLLDRKVAHPATFSDLSGSNTLGVFLGQELDRFNALLTIMRTSLSEVQKAIKGIVIMSAELEAMYNAMLYNVVPPKWTAAAYPSLKSLGAWVDDLLARVSFLRSWIENQPPAAFWLSGFFFPQGFLTAVLQRYARQTRIPIDTLKFATHVSKLASPAEVSAAPAKGVYIYGLYLQGASFDASGVSGAGILVESPPAELFSPMPLIHLEPVTIDEPAPLNVYECPVYKTTRRAGTLSTTGHSTNFVLYLRQCTLQSRLA